MTIPDVRVRHGYAMCVSFLPRNEYFTANGKVRKVYYTVVSPENKVEHWGYTDNYHDAWRYCNRIVKNRRLKNVC